MKTNKVIKNYVYNVMYQILAIIIPLITTPYLARVLGAERLGVFGYTISITSFFILFTANGIILHGKREIAYNQKNEKERSKIFYELLIIRLVLMIISLLIYYPVFCIKGNYSMYYKVLILEIVANTLDISWFFQGLEEFKKTVFRNMIVKIISVISIFVFIKNSMDLYKYFIIYTLSILIGNFSLWLYLPKYIGKTSIRELNIKRHIKSILVLFVPQVAAQVYLLLDKVMLGTIISDKSEVGYYEQAQKIINLSLTIATSLGTVMLPRIANLYAENKFDEIKKFMKESFGFILLICFPLMFGIISISNKFVPIFFGQGYDKVVILLCLLSPIIVFVGLSNVTGIQYLLPTKQQKKYTTSILIGAGTNFILNSLLIRFYASIGATIATIFAELFVMMSQFYMIRKQINIMEVLKMGRNYLFASLIMLVMSVFVGHFISNNILSILIQVPVSILTYLIVLLIVKDTFVINIKKTIKNRRLKDES